MELNADHAIGAAGGILLLLAIKYLLLGEAQWNDLMAPLHRIMPGNIKDTTGKL